MSLENKYLEGTPLTSTENRYVAGYLEQLEKDMQKFVYGFSEDLKRKSAPGNQLFTNICKKSLLTSTDKKLLFENESYLQKKKKKKKCLKKYFRARSSERDGRRISYDRERGLSSSDGDEIYAEMDQSLRSQAMDCPDSFSLSAIDASAISAFGSSNQEQLGSFGGKQLNFGGDRGGFELNSALPPRFGFPEKRGFAFDSVALMSRSGFKGNTGFTFGSRAPPSPHRFGFSAAASPAMLFQAPTALSANIPETVIPDMPSYAFSAFNIKETPDFNIFSTYLVHSSEHCDNSVINFKAKKLQFLNVVSMALTYSSNLKDANDMYRNILLKIASEVMVFDPEFILKVALYARQELQIRNVTNFLLAYAALHETARFYLEKYFTASIVLPLDWLQVVEHFQALVGPSGQKSLPGPLRRAMKKAFAKFDEYQLGKYNRKRKKKTSFRKKEIMMMDSEEDGDTDNNEARSRENISDIGCEEDGDTDDNEAISRENISYVKTPSLKHLVKRLHISRPAEHVLGILEKKYPKDYNAFLKSGLSGKWDPAKAGKRMRLPVPQTWETQLCIHGNVASVWESLIDQKKLPYMAALRNMKNLIMVEISPKHRRKVISFLENKNAVIKSRQLPMQFYEAYKALVYLEDMKAENSNDDKKIDKSHQPTWEKKRLNKLKEKMKNVSMSVIEEYKCAVTKALEISSLNNMYPIPGKTLVICEIPPPNKDAKFNMKVIDTCIMTGLMVMKASEDCKMIMLYCTNTPEEIKDNKDQSFLDALKINCDNARKHRSTLSAYKYEEYASCNVSTLQIILDSYLKPKKRLSVKLDQIVFLHVSSDDAGVKMKDIMSSFLVKYRQSVNEDLLYTDVNFSLRSKSFEESSISGKDVYLCGSGSSLLKFIADRSGCGQLAYVESIDQKFSLPEINEYKKAYIGTTSDLPGKTVSPLNLRVPKWHTVRIFVSSTFRDMISERDMLIRYVFPELRKRAASIFVRIAEIDLRWGITETDSASKRAAELCLIEAQRSDLFVGLIGERYGTIYNFEPPDIPELNWVKDSASGLSITELEMHAAALKDPESSRKKAFFYFRDNSFISHVPQKWSNHFTSEDANSGTKVRELKSKVKINGFKVFEYPCKWAGIFENKPILAGLEILGNKVLEDLWEAIKNVHDLDPFENDISEEEMYQQNLFDSLSSFVGEGTSPFHSVIKYINSMNGIFVITGVTGSGKTALSIHLLQNIRKSVVVKFFIGVSPRSQDLTYMLQYICLSICQQLAVTIPIPDIPEDIVNHFPDFLIEAANSSGGKDIIMLLDGLDHLDSSDQRLTWLPLSLPNRIKLICSATDTSEAFKVLFERQTHGSSVIIGNMSPFLQSERVQFVKNYLEQYRKTLDESAFSNHLLRIVTKKDSVNPLYLRIVCDFLRIYASFDNLLSILQTLPSTVPLLLQEIILQMENEFGTTLVQTALTLLCISKFGLEENDLHYIISFVGFTSSQKIASFGELKEKIIFLEPKNLLTQVKFCSLMHTIVTFAYGRLRLRSFTLYGTEFELAVKKFYMNKNFVNNCMHLHSVLAAYYHSMCDLNNDGKYSGQSGFAIRALLYHLFQGCLYKELCDLLCLYEFVEAVFRTKADDQLLEYYSSMLFDVLKANQKISREISYNKLALFYNFISRNFHVFRKYPYLVMQQALNEPSSIKLRSGEINYSSVENLSRDQVADCRLATLCGFSKNITAAAGEKVRPIVALGSEDGYLKVLDVSTRKVIHSIKSHFSPITCICYTKNRLCVSSADGTLSLWDSQDFSRVAALEGHRLHVTSLCTDPTDSFLFSSGWDNAVRLWSLSDGRLVSAIDDFRCPVSCIDHHPTKEQIACGLWNGSIEIWDHKDMKRINVFKSSSGSVKSIAFTPDGINIIASFLESEVLILSSEEGLKMSSLKGHILPVKTLTFSYDLSIFISGSDDCSLKVWSSISGFNLSTIDECKFCPINLMEFVSQNLLAIAFQNSEVWVSDVNCGKTRAKFNLAPEIVSCFSKCSAAIVNKDLGNDVLEKSLIFGLQSGKLMIGDLLSSSTVVRAEMNSRITAVSHNPEIIISGCADGDIGIFSYSDHKLSRILPGVHKSFITTLCVISKRHYSIIWSTSNDNVLKIWKVKKSNLDLSFEVEFHNKHKDSITCSAYHPVQHPSPTPKDWIQCLLTGSHDNNIIKWNEGTSQIFEGLRSSVLYVCSSKDYIIGCGNDGSVVIWSQTGKILTSIPGIELSSATLTFHITEDDANGFVVLLSYVERDGTVKIIKPLEKTFCCSLVGHSKAITSCCVAKNGEIISCSLDGSVNLWKMSASVSENHPLHSSTVTGIIISPSYEFVLSSDVNGNLILWKIDVMSSTSPLVYAAKKNYVGGFLQSLSWLKNSRFVCAVNQMVDTVENYFLNILSVEHTPGSDGTTYNLCVNDLYKIESEILCLDSCPVTDVITVGLKSGEILVITSEKQKLRKMSDDWLCGVRLLTRTTTSDLFCASFVDGKVKLFSVADFLDSKDESPTPFAIYERPDSYDAAKFTSAMCCGADRVICCGDSLGALKIYSRHSLKFSKKVHSNSITGICILGPYIFTSSLDKTVKGWSLQSYEQVCQFHCHVQITCLASPKVEFSATNSYDYMLAIGTESGEVFLLKFHSK